MVKGCYSNVCWNCLVCGTHFWTVTKRFQSSFLPQTLLDSCKASQDVFWGNLRAREEPEWPNMFQHLSSGTAAVFPALQRVLSSVVTLGEINIETEFCTAHKAATLRLLKCFCLFLSHCKAQIPHTAFWQMLFGILSQDWCVQVEIFILFYFVRLCVVVSNEKFLTASALDFQIW